MACKYDIHIKKLHAGKLNEVKEHELLEHSKECEQCSAILVELDKITQLIKNELIEYPYESKKNLILSKVHNRKIDKTVLFILFNFRRYAYSIAIVFILITSSLFIKLLLNNNYSKYVNKVSYVQNSDENNGNSTSEEAKQLEDLKIQLNDLIRKAIDIQYGTSNISEDEVFSSSFIEKIKDYPNFYKKNFNPYKIINVNENELKDVSDSNFIVFVRMEDSNSGYTQVIHFIKSNGKFIINEIEFDI